MLIDSILEQNNPNNNSIPVFNPILYPWANAPSQSKRIKKILIIDDDKDMSELLTAALKSDESIQIESASDPFEAMNKMTDTVFDLIVLDWNLPKLNGLETLVEAEKGFKFDPNLPLEWDKKKVRVVILSASDKSACKPPNTKHFRYTGYINKSKSLDTIVNDLRHYFHKLA